MSFIHYLFVGRFDRDEHGVRFARHAPGEPYRPVVRQPLTGDEIAAAIRSVTGTPGGLPDEGTAWLDEGYLICDLYTRNSAEIEFITYLVEWAGCSLYDCAGHTNLSLSEWLARVRSVPVHEEY